MTKVRPLILIFLFYALPFIAHADSVQEDKVYKIGLPNVPGVMYRNESGEPSGFFCEVVLAIAEDENLKIEWIDGSWGECFAALKNGEIDTIPIVSVTEERKEFLDYAEHNLYVFWSELFILKNSNMNSIRDIENKRIGLVEGDNNALGFVRYMSSFDIVFIPVSYQSHNEAVIALDAGEIWGISGPMNLIDDSNSSIKTSGIFYNPANTTFAFTKGQNFWLQERINNRLSIYKNDKDSIYYELLDKYGMSGISEEVKIPQWLLLLIIFLTLILIISVAFVVTLRHQVNVQSAEIINKEIALKQAQKMEAIGQLAGGVAHDFNNLLGGIMGYAELLSTYLEGNEPYHEYSETIIDTSARASKLIEKLLTFSRKTDAKLDCLSFKKVVANSMEIMKHTIPKNISIISDFTVEPDTIKANEAELQNVILNLGINARDAMKNGGTLNLATSKKHYPNDFKVEQHIQIEEGDYLHLVVSDTGIGMDENTLSHLFEPFFTTKDVGKGTGLGLATVFGTVISMGGAIDVSSKEGVGTMFNLYFPMCSKK